MARLYGSGMLSVTPCAGVLASGVPAAPHVTTRHGRGSRREERLRPPAGAIRPQRQYTTGLLIEFPLHTAHIDQSCSLLIVNLLDPKHPMQPISGSWGVWASITFQYQSSRSSRSKAPLAVAPPASVIITLTSSRPLVSVTSHGEMRPYSSVCMSIPEMLRQPKESLSWIVTPSGRMIRAGCRSHLPSSNRTRALLSSSATLRDLLAAAPVGGSLAGAGSQAMDAIIHTLASRVDEDATRMGLLLFDEFVTGYV